MVPTHVEASSVSTRTKAERSVDNLTAELRRLRAVPQPSKEQYARMRDIEKRKLPAAWRVVNQVREGTR